MRPLGLLLGVLVLVLGACGGASSPQEQASPAEVLEQAAARMAEAGSARFTVQGTMRNREIATRPLEFGAKGVSRFDGKQAWIWWDLSKIFPAMAASGLPAGQREDFRRYLDDPRGWRAEVRIRAKSAWMQIPALNTLLGGKPWIRLSEGGQGGTGLDDAQGFSWVDPASLIVYLRAARRLEIVAEEEGLTHYRGRVMLERVPALKPKRDRARVRKTIRQVIAQTGRRALPLEVWIDADGVPRRFKVIDVEPRERHEKYPTVWRATIDILEYGVDFSVLRPPARKVMTEAEFDRAIGR